VSVVYDKMSKHKVVNVETFCTTKCRSTERSWGSCSENAQLECDAAAASQVTLSNVEAYVTELAARVRSVTVYDYVCTLRRAAKLLAPISDFSWLVEIERDLALVMVPRSKFDRLVSTGRLVEASLTLMVEAQGFANSDLARARGVTTINGIDIIPIDNSADLYREGASMHHCVGTYAEAVRAGRYYVYSIRQAGDRLATAGLILGKDGAQLDELRGPCNAAAPKQITVTVRRWLRTQASPSDAGTVA
jgi:hypothetical protein